MSPRNFEAQFPVLQRAVRQAAAETGAPAAYLPLMVHMQRETTRKAANAQTFAVIGLLVLGVVLVLVWLKPRPEAASNETQQPDMPHAQVQARPPYNPAIHGSVEEYRASYRDATGQEDRARSAQRVGLDAESQAWRPGL